MSGSRPNINKAWSVTFIAIAAVVAPTTLLARVTLHPSGRMVVWPEFALSFFMMALWLWVWITSLKNREIPAHLALITFLVTALPIYAATRQWQCIVGQCFW